MTERLKVLISAYACSPYKGSELGVGWGFVSELAKHHDLWVIVEDEKCRDDIEHYLAEHPNALPSVKFLYLCKQRNRALRKIWPPSYYWYYRRWQQDALALAKILHAEIDFDLAHQLTMVGFREPGYLWQLGIPFVWGPVGGLGIFPWRFIFSVGWYGAFYYLGYNLYNIAQMKFMTRPSMAANVAGLGLFAATPDNQREILKHWGVANLVITEVGLPYEPTLSVCRRNESEPLRIIWTGLHIPRKALNLGLAALEFLPSPLKIEMHILGQGPRTKAWKQLADQLGVAKHCHFHGWLPRDQALDVMKSSHVLLITSLRDLTSTITIEALALGLPIICLDHCGFAHVVNDTCGIKVPLSSPSEAIAGLAKAITQLEQDEALRLSLAKGAVIRSQDFAWQNKVEVVNDIYRRKMVEARQTGVSS